MGTSNKQKRLIELVLRGLYVFASVPGVVATLFILPGLLFGGMPDGQNIFAPQFLLYWFVPSLLVSILIFYKKQRLWLIIVCYLILEMIFALYLAAFEFPLLVALAVITACAVTIAYQHFLWKFNLKLKLYVVIVIAILYGLFILPANTSLNIYILIGEWLRDITNWQLNIFYFDYQGFIVLFASILSSLSVLVVWILNAIVKEI